MEGQFGRPLLVVVVELGGEYGEDVLSFRFCCVGGKSVLSDEACVVLFVFEEGVLIDGADGVLVDGIYLLEVPEWRLLLVFLLSRLLLEYRGVDLPRKSLRSSLLVSS